MRLAIVTFVTALLGVSASAQSAGKSDFFSAPSIREKLDSLGAQAKTAGSSGATLADYGSYKLQFSVRTSSGGGEIHAHFDDVMIVQQGTATLITGGSLIAPKTNADGETRGTGIQGGKSQTISVGDVVTVNAGVPHQIKVPAGTTYSALVIKVKE
jgi:mannose-6-phosphate isomerase-like protein (cupin superfamily)